jgi:amino acid adenylation domain-containing protein
MSIGGRRRQLTPRQLARVRELRREDEAASGATISRRRAAAVPPLSVGEEQIWFLARLEDDPSYNIPFELCLRGPLDVAALAAGIAAFAARHEALRTAYPAPAGRPLRVAIPDPPTLPVIELRGLPAAVREVEADRLTRDLGRRPFALERGPLLRTALLALAGDVARLFFCCHHIVADGGSIAILWRELPVLYRDLARRAPASLAAPRLQIGDFAAWQADWIRGEEAAAQRAFWREQLPGVATLDLPTDRPGPAATSRGGVIPMALPAACGEALRQLGRDERATLFMVLLAAFQALLHRWSGQCDFTVGSPVSGRQRPELAEVFGFLVNMVVLRADLAGDPPLRAAVGRARETALGAFSRSDLPFASLVAELRPDRSLSRTPLFRAALVLQDPPAGVVAVAGLAWEIREVLTGTAKFDLELELRHGPDSLSGRLWYARDLFDAATARRLAGHLETLFAGAAGAPDRRLSELPLLAAPERHQVTVAWAGERRRFPGDRGIHQLFAEQAARTPAATAVTFGGARISYRELDRQADRIARRLRSLGIGAESRVGIFAERSLAMVTATLGVLKAGAAYVPLDVASPGERLEWLAADARLGALLVQERLTGRLAAPACRRLILEEEPAAGEAAVADAEAALPATWAGPDSAAYLMYTSGSTGFPKGVTVTHRNVVRLVRDTDFASFSPGEVVLQLAPVSFDAATLEIWGALLNGATLAVCDPGLRSLAELGRTIEREGVSTLWLTAGLFHQMVDRQLPSLAGVRQLLAGGDVLSPALVARALAALPGCRLINGYGPTENTTFTCCHQVAAPLAGPVPIGRPIANTWVQVVDRAGRPVPIGVAGELLAGGEGLARGYFDRPDLTAERFVPDPLTGEPGARLYRTGDLVRRRPDGTIDFLGRFDGQVKIRGFRVETAEVERALERHPEVAACAVVARRDAPDDVRLVAYVVPATGAAATAPAAGELRAFLARSLPEPMLPAAFVRLTALPITRNGKLDRDALPAPPVLGDSTEAAAAGPRAPDEELLAGIWCEVLGRQQVGADMDFFALGGQSLQLMQVASRVRDAFGVELPLRALFEAPTVPQLAALLARRRGSTASLLPPVRRRPRGDGPPLSFAQRRLWFLDRLEPGRATYNVPLSVELHGPLHVAALAAALGEILRRHEALRTIFPTRRGEPFQEVLAAVPPALRQVDLAALPEERRHGAAEDLAGAAARRPFDLGRGPLMRLLVLRLAADEHCLVVSCHHIAADGWSLQVLLGELQVLYAALLRGAPTPWPVLPELPVQYADYAAWQLEWLQGEILDRQLGLWRERLAGLQALDLATDHPRPLVRSQRGAMKALGLAAGVLALLRTAARREGATLFTFLLASLQALLHRYSGQEDFAIGTPTAGRRRPELEPLIGFFANTLVLRGRLAAGMPFRTLLAACQETMLAAHDHQDVPFERLVEELRPERDLGRTPFFQVMLTLDTGGSLLQLPGLATSVRTAATDTAKFDLGFSLLAAPDGWGQIVVEFATDLFEPATVARLLEHWSRLLAGAAADPAGTVADLPLVTGAERQQLLREWNDTAVPGFSPSLLHQLFEARAALAPEAVAVVCRGEVWTYGELNARANRLARHLRALGVRRGSPVAVRLRRSPQMLLAVYAILKAGGAYVPLDHRYPDARIRWILGHLDISWALTDRRELSRLAGLGAPGLRHAVCLGRDGEAAAPAPEMPAASGLEISREDAGAPLPAGDLPAEGGVDDPAYVLFTSGSTGTPKGVMVSHRPVAALVEDIRQRFVLRPDDRGLQVTALSFDLSVFDVFGLLASGASLRIAVEEEIAEPREIARILCQEPITFWNSAPAFLQQAALFLPRTAEPGAALRLVMLAGDWIPVPLPDRVRAAFPGAEVVTLGGPTETVVWTNVNRVRAVDPRWPSIPYGRPLSGVRLHLLDESQNPCPAGVPGEIYVGGGCLAIGYAGDPEATARKFLPDPFGSQPGARLYASGDQARHRPDGVIEFLGRRDTQVKIRGFRIELGEIEAALRTAPGVRETVAIVREDRPGDRQLVAYWCGDPLPGFSPRQFLAERLPEYMVPAACVWLDALPVTANGKLDRRALPSPAAPDVPDAHAANAAHSATFAAAHLTPTEELLAGIWADVLGREGIGREDHFFDLGGHSLTATQVVSRLSEALRIELPVRAIFETPRLGELARRLERELPAGATQRQREPPRPIDRGERIPLSLAQQRLWFLDRLEPGIYNVPVLLDWEGALDAHLLARALAAILARHEPLRTAIEMVEGEPVQVIGPPPGCRLPRLDLAALPAGRRAAAAETLATALGRAAFDLAAGSPVRFLLFRLAEREHRLLAVFHHIATDGWSLAVFLRELGELYRAFEAGAADPLPPLPLQYADFAAWQREGLRGAWLQRDLAYWRQRLDGLPVLELPTDRPRPARRTFRGASRPFVPPAALGARLQAAARAQGATRFMVLLTALAALLARLSGQEDFAIGTPVANRGQTWTAGLIGYFVNTLALRTSLAGLPSFDELLRRVRDTALGAYAHQELPFEWLVDELAPPRDLSHAPLYQVRFAFQDELPAPDLPGRRLRVQGLAVEVAKFDLLLSLGESLEGYLQYNTDLFDPATAERLIRRFARLLEAALDAPDAPLAELPLLDAAERQLLLVEWNDTGAPGPAAAVHERFAGWAARRPEAPALVCEEVRFSYGELAARVDRLAARLRALGVGAESLVGICLPRSADAVLALLAVLTAGGAYVPLDPSHPAERLADLLSAAGASVVITAAELEDRLPAGTVVVCLDGGSAQVAPAAPAAPATAAVAAAGAPAGAAGLERLAYVLFTSGSTGRPKGVAVGHRQLAGYVDGVLCRLGLPAGAAYATVSTLAADLGNTAVFPALSTGGCLHVIAERRVTDPSLFAEILRRERIDCLKIVPSHLAALQSGVDPAAALPRLRLVLGGEASTWEMVAGLRAAAPGLGVLNHYGPTEATVGVLTWPVAERVAGAASVPLGRPLPQARVYVLDHRLQPLPAGVPGELAIGGDSLARGYHREPATTAERFVPDPFAGRPGARLYRTGDRARQLPDGAVEFLGRLDHQVKIRGFRVEPAEIEVALARVAGVREAVVMTRPGADGSPELVAWIAGERLPEPAALREALRGELPLYMIPAAFVPLTSLPLTANGKVDRQALPAPERRSAVPAAPPPATVPERRAPAAAPPSSPLAQQIAAIWREVLGCEEVGLHDNFFDLGGHSLLLIRVRRRLHRELGHATTVLDLFRHPTVSALAAHLGGTPMEVAASAPAPAGPHPAPPSLQSPPAQDTPAGRQGIAVIGLAGRFPGAANVRQLWENLCRGVESITFSGAPRDVAPGQRHVPARGTLADLELFDAAFFAIRPREAELLDPQHRLFLECAWEALESAGYDPARTPGAIGVWSGVGKAWYYLNQIHGGPDAEHYDAHFGNDKDFLPTRVSYKLGLRGPSLSVQTSCSSSLVAIHLACRSLADRECDMALAGGARVIVPQDQGYICEEGGIASPDGHCRAFDADAGGLVPGNGIAVVLLKRLADALADGDPVLAVIKGSAINNDGAAKVGYNAPSVEGQARVIQAAHAAAGVTAGSISYVETHGTGTVLGDPIEIAALKQAFAGAGEGVGEGGRNACALGALKTNIGHLDAASGAAGLIKAVLALHHRTIPPTLHFRRPNPELGLEESPFFVNTALRAWQPAGGPRRAGVSAFGMGGTNAHVVLEEAPPAEPSGPSRRWQLLTVSARTRSALARAAEQLAEHLAAEPDDKSGDVADVAWTLHVGRRAFPHRRAVVVGPGRAATAALRSAAGDGEAAGDATVAFLFPGQGAQHPGMTWDLYRLEPVFRAGIDRAAALLQGRLGLDLRTLLDPPAERYDEAAQRLERTELTQPALFAVEHALARLWMSWGVRPAAMLGHSVGEYVAACLAGVFSYEDALALVAERGRLMGELPTGAMLAVPLPEDEVRARLGAGLALAAVNGATSAVVSGETLAVAALRERLRTEGIEARRLRVSHAFHSAAMDPIVDTFAAAASRVERRPPTLAWVSSVSGTWIEPGEATDPAYWGRQLRQTVRFHDGAGTLLADPRCLLLEVGPGETLSRLARRHPAARGRTVLACLASADAGSSGQRALLAALGRLWTAGIEPDWPGFHAGERRRRVPLPTYPFERQPYWAGGRDRETGAVREAATDRQDAAPPSPVAPAVASALAPAAPSLAAEAGDEIERTIASIWRELFGLPQVGLQDGFYALGGDSLLATQIVARMRTALSRDISLGSFLEAETIAGQAAICRALPAMTPAADTASLLADLESRSAEELESLLAPASRGGAGEPTTPGPQ